MPILTLKFKLPEEKEEAQLAQKAGELYSMLYEIAMYRRSLYKYEERIEIPKAEIEQKLAELLADFEY